MGWCSGTQIFDPIVGALLGKSKQTKEEIISNLIDALEEMDWDCQQDSQYWGHPVIQKIFREKHPDWFEESKQR